MRAAAAPRGWPPGSGPCSTSSPRAAPGLAISHTPLVERAAFGLTGAEVAPFRECEGILVRRDADGTITVEELRLARGRRDRPVSAWSDHLVPAFALGAALGAAPGPVQLLILNETARHGIGQGFRVMLGANGMLFVVLATLALGFSTVEPSPSSCGVSASSGGSSSCTSR